MSLAFSTTKIEPSTEGFDKLALLEATENLNQAWMDLTEAQRGMDEVCVIMENIHTSVDLINKFGKDAIPMLNVDGGLEALLQIPENVITAEKAMEGLGEAAKAGWEKFKEGVKKVVAWFKNVIKIICDRFAELFKQLVGYRNAYNKGVETGKEEYKKAFVASTIATGHYVILNGVIDNELKNLSALVNDLCLFASSMHAMPGNEHTDGAKAAELKEKFDNTAIFDTLENGKFFLQSQGDAEKDSWSKCGYNNPDEIFTEIEKAKALLQIIATLEKKCIDVIQVGIDRADEADKEKYADIFDDERQVVVYAKKVLMFASSLLKATASMSRAAMLTTNELKKKFNIADSTSEEQK